jgi:hypothetical protein
MNKALLFLILLFSVLHTTDAQWYYKSCDVTDIKSCTYEEFQCLWERASHNILVGKITTIYGTIATVTGIIWGGQAYDLAVILPYGIMTAGLITLSIGLPIWITGHARKSNLRENQHYKNLNFGNVKVAPTINKNHINNSYSVGLKMTLAL